VSENGYCHNNLTGSKRWLCPRQQVLAIFIFRQYRNYNRFVERPEEDHLSTIQLTHQGTQGLVQGKLEQRLLRSKDIMEIEVQSQANAPREVSTVTQR